MNAGDNLWRKSSESTTREAVWRKRRRKERARSLGSLPPLARSCPSRHGRCSGSIGTAFIINRNRCSRSIEICSWGRKTDSCSSGWRRWSGGRSAQRQLWQAPDQRWHRQAVGPKKRTRSQQGRFPRHLGRPARASGCDLALERTPGPHRDPLASAVRCVRRADSGERARKCVIAMAGVWPAPAAESGGHRIPGLRLPVRRLRSRDVGCMPRGRTLPAPYGPGSPRWRLDANQGAASLEDEASVLDLIHPCPNDAFQQRLLGG